MGGWFGVGGRVGVRGGGWVGVRMGLGVGVGAGGWAGGWRWEVGFQIGEVRSGCGYTVHAIMEVGGVTVHMEDRYPCPVPCQPEFLPGGEGPTGTRTANPCLYAS